MTLKDLVGVTLLATFWTPAEPSSSEGIRGHRLQCSYPFHQDSEPLFTLQCSFRLNHEICDNSPMPFLELPPKCPEQQVIPLQFTAEMS